MPEVEEEGRGRMPRRKGEGVGRGMGGEGRYTAGNSTAGPISGAKQTLGEPFVGSALQ